MKKRMLALLLCFAMVFSMIPGQALAQEDSSTEETQPQVTEPETTEPGVTEPEETEPEVTEPEETEPEETEPEATEETAPEDEPSAQSDLPGGSCGDNATWTFDESTGVLAISGSGAIYDFSEPDPYDPSTVQRENPWEEYMDQILSVEIGEGITRIGGDSFSLASNLVSVSLPESLTAIDSAAFYSAASLTNITIPDSLTTLGESAFRGCKALKITSLPEGMEFISSKAFLESGIAEFSFPRSITSIQSQVLSGCNDLKAVFIPSSIQYIAGDAFRGSGRLADIYYEGSEEEWAAIKPSSSDKYNNATVHYNCTELGVPGESEAEILSGQCGDTAYWELNLSTGVLSITGSGKIDDFDFSPPWEDYADQILEVHISEGIKNLPIASFTGCAQMSKIIVPASLTSFDTSVFDSINLITTAGPIGSGCDYEFGWTEHIPAFAFEYLPITEITVPETLVSVTSSAFNGCGSLTDVYYPGTPTQWEAIEINTWHNGYFINANIHYGASDSEDSTILRDVRYYLDWEEAEQRVYFGPDGLLADSCAVSEETDSAFLADPTAYQGSYVLVETKLAGDEEILISMTLPQTYTGTVTAISTGGITIGDKVYRTTGGIEALEDYLGKTVLYHVLNDELVSIEILQEKTGFLTSWHLDARQMWIQSSEISSDSKHYHLSSEVPDDDTVLLKLGYIFVENNNTDTWIRYLVDKNRVIYRIAPLTEKRNNGFSENEHGWPIVNSRTSFGYPTGYAIDPWVYYAHGQSIRSIANENLNSLKKIEWNGNCFGLSMLAVAQYTRNVNLAPYFTQSNGSLNTFGYNSIDNPGTGDRCVLYHYESGRVVYNSALIQKIEQAQVSFYSSALQDVKEELHYSDFHAFLDYLQGDNPVPLVIGLTYFDHAVVIDTTTKPIYIGNNKYLVPLYDSNAPQAPVDMVDPWKPYNYNQSMLYLDLEGGYWGYWYNNKLYEKDGIEVIKSHGDKKLEIFNIAGLDQSFFDSQYSFDSEYLTYVYGVCGNMEIIKVDSSTGEHTTVFKRVGGVITTANVEELFIHYENAENDGAMYKGGIRLPLGNYIIRTDGEAYIQCMYDNDIFVLGADNGIEALLELPKDKLSIIGTQDDTTVACVHASSEIDFCTSLESTINTRETITLSANSETRSASVVTNIPVESITLQHAVDGELIDITPDMIHQHKDLVHNDAVEATCTVPGQTEHYLCSCGKTFAGEDAYEEISDVVIPALGHVGQWAPTGNAEGEEFRVCERCGEEEIRMAGSLLVMDPEVLGDHASVWIDGLIYPVQTENGKAVIQLPEGDAFYMQTYTFHVGDETDVHTQYPTSMQVWRVEKDAEGTFTADRIEELDDLLQYSGSSIRITGNKGIRMITSITKGNKSALTGEGLAGFTLEEYGTALCWATDLAEGEDLVLGKDYTRSNYAYKKDVADPIFAQTDTLIQYTNVLVGFTDDQCIPDIAMRPYIILTDAQGNQVTLYGGTVQRSIGYIAYQNRNVFSSGTGSYDYVWNIIHHVYGDQYDADYQG